MQSKIESSKKAKKKAEKFAGMKKGRTFASSNRFGSIAQLVQSTCLTSRGSQVRILLLPQNKKPCKFNHCKVFLFVFCFDLFSTSMSKTTFSSLSLRQFICFFPHNSFVFCNHHLSNSFSVFYFKILI